MFGLEAFVEKYFQQGTDLTPLLGLIALMFINSTISIYAAIKNKEFDWDRLVEYVKPLTMYMALLFVLEICIVASKPYEILKLGFTAAQIGSWGAIAWYYIRQIYNKLKSLGMPGTPELDQEIEKDNNDVSQKEENPEAYEEMR